MWPDMVRDCATAPEWVLLFESAGGRPLTLASNCPYELWRDGRFVGDGGHRCVPGEVLADAWPETTSARSIRVRLHWIDPAQTEVYYRCLFDDPFLAELPPAGSWSCSLDETSRFAAKVCQQLPRQTVTLPPRPAVPRLLRVSWLDRPWKVLAPPIERARYVAVELGPISSVRLLSERSEPFRPEAAKNVAEYIRDDRPCPLRCDTFDLGRIALHRFEVDAGPVACALTYSEVSDFAEAAGTSSRKKVQLADAVAAGAGVAAPFGTRGCRYVHVVSPADGPPPALRAWRREYPLRWKPVAVAPEDEAIVAACRANLLACIDGGAIDTCWRERAQWTGDLRMSAAALSALADNPEVIDLALHQIAQSYNPQTGMVNGAWPIWKPGADFPIPPFHLAFCLTSLEHDPSLSRDPLVRRVVEESLAFWSRAYLRAGLVQGMPGWYFTDWDPTDPTVAANGRPYPGPHAVCNAWWNEWCDRMAPAQAVAPAAFDAAFWAGRCYALTADKSGDSPHATAAALNSSAGRVRTSEALHYLEEELAAGRLARRVTPYFACFVARAFRLASHERAVRFIREFYGPIAREHGTIYEKTAATSSLAHGWSVGFVPMLIQGQTS
jgi:hypothetical protein